MFLPDADLHVTCNHRQYNFPAFPLSFDTVATIAMSTSYAYCTLITRSSYLAGVIILAHTLRKHGSPYPLIVLYTDTLSSNAIDVLRAESQRNGLILHPVSALLPAGPVSLIAERFADTWTKLRVFQLHELGPYSRICYLDADMAIFQNPDHIFNTQIPDDWIAANHACVCNLDRDPWAPVDWTIDSCAYTPLSQSSPPTPVTPASRGTYHLLNSGMFLFRPSEELWQNMLAFFNTAPLGQYLFPDQDFLAEFFRNRWLSIGWEFNAIKTMRYWHPNMWSDEKVVVLHYIVDKPWTKRVGQDGVAGYLGKDGVTHQWWWKEWHEWASSRAAEVVQGVPVARAEGEEEDQLMRAIGSAVQAMATQRVCEVGEGDLEKSSVVVRA